jgi:uncharacterized protein
MEDDPDTRLDYREERRITVGQIEWRIYAIAYTMRGEITRLISARKANRRERRRYYEALPA